MRFCKTWNISFAIKTLFYTLMVGLGMDPSHPSYLYHFDASNSLIVLSRFHCISQSCILCYLWKWCAEITMRAWWSFLLSCLSPVYRETAISNWWSEGYVSYIIRCTNKHSRLHERGTLTVNSVSTVEYWKLVSGKLILTFVFLHKFVL